LATLAIVNEIVVDNVQRAVAVMSVLGVGIAQAYIGLMATVVNAHVRHDTWLGFRTLYKMSLKIIINTICIMFICCVFSASDELCE